MLEDFSATQTSAGPAAMSSAPLPTIGASGRTRPVAASTRVSDGSVRLVSQSSPPTTASAFGRRPTCAIVCPTPGMSSWPRVAIATAIATAQATKAARAAARTRGRGRAGASGRGALSVDTSSISPGSRCARSGDAAPRATIRSERDGPPAPAAPSAARPRSPADGWRSSGAFAIARMTTWSNAAGSP